MLPIDPETDRIEQRRTWLKQCVRGLWGLVPGAVTLQVSVDEAHAVARGMQPYPGFDPGQLHGLLVDLTELQHVLPPVLVGWNSGHEAVLVIELDLTFHDWTTLLRAIGRAGAEYQLNELGHTMRWQRKPVQDDPLLDIPF